MAADGDYRGDAIALRVQKLSVRAGAQVLLSDVSFELMPGQRVAVLGPNGAGKTTLLEAIAGLRSEATGIVATRHGKLDGFRARTSALSYMPEAVTLPEETTLGVALGLSPGDPWVKRFELEELIHARSTEVSRGESKRAQLCAALRLERAVALLDEPFSTLDPRQLRVVLPLVHEAAGRSAVLASVHELRTAELFADHILLLNRGRPLAFGTLDDLRERAHAADATLEDVFLRLLERDDSGALS